MALGSYETVPITQPYGLSPVAMNEIRNMKIFEFFYLFRALAYCTRNALNPILVAAIRGGCTVDAES